MKYRILIAGLIFSIYAGEVFAQDTVAVSLDKFIKTGIENSGQIKFERQNVRLAKNKIDQANSQRYLPQFELNTQHGLVPGVVSQREDLEPNEYYLDPELENDWEDWAVYTRAEVSAVQPLFAWGALRNLVNAAKAGARAAEEQFLAGKANIEIRLFELYQSYVLTLELERLLEEAKNQIEKIDRQLTEMQQEGDPELDESDVFKFEVFQSEFAIRIAEVRENSEYVRGVWNYVLQGGDETVYVPDIIFLNPVNNKIQALDFYRTLAVEQRPEVQAIESGIEAAGYGLKATKAQNYPTLFLGVTGSYANTPNRPRQSNPFIINNTNYASGAVGLGIRQNLDFFSMNVQVEESRIQYKQAQYLKEAAIDGIVLEVSDKYKNVNLSKTKIEQTNDALVTSKKWLRQEQLDYDFGIGETKDLLDAMRKELELRVQYRQQVFEYNEDMAELFKASGISITALEMNKK